MSMSSRKGGESRISDDDGKTAVKVGEWHLFLRTTTCFIDLTSRITDDSTKAVRVRPPLQSQDPGYDLIPQRFRNSILHVNSPTSLTIEGKKLFVFDRVFAPDTDQDGVWEYLSESIDAFVQGYNVSVLAYGQSGAGKSFTMGTSGPEEQEDPRTMGVVPRAAIALFDKLSGNSVKSGLRSPNRYSMMNGRGLHQQQDQDKNWQMKATYVEVYQVGTSNLNQRVSLARDLIISSRIHERL